MGIAPITGIPLPFVSVGGSSMITNLPPWVLLRRSTPAADGGAHDRRTDERAVPLSVFRAVREGRAAPGTAPLAVAGARELVPLLASGCGGRRRVRGARERRAGVRRRSSGSARPTRRRSGASLRGSADRRRDRGGALPYVLDTNIVLVRPGQGLPVAEIAAALARALGRRAGLAARLPVLRPAVVDDLIRRRLARTP